MKFFRAFLTTVLYTVFVSPVFATNPDNREEVDVRNYPGIVRIGHNGKTCTGQFVAPNLVVTAAHCSTPSAWKNPDKKFYLYTPRHEPGTIVPTKLKRGKLLADRRDNTSDVAGVGDYMFLLIEDPKDYCNDCFYDLYDMSLFSGNYLPVYNIGFGGMKILTTADIEILKRIYISSGKNGAPAMRSQNIQAEIDKQLPDLFKDSKRLKKNKEPCGLLYNVDCSKKCDTNNKDADLKGCRDLCGGKIGLTPSLKNFPKILYNDCYAVGGNSGGPYITVSDNKLAAIVNGGSSDVYYDKENQTDVSIAVSNIQFKDVLEKLKKEYPPKSLNEVGMDNKVDSKTVKKDQAKKEEVIKEAELEKLCKKNNLGTWKRGKCKCSGVMNGDECIAKVVSAQTQAVSTQSTISAATSNGEKVATVASPVEKRPASDTEEEYHIEEPSAEEIQQEIAEVQAEKERAAQGLNASGVFDNITSNTSSERIVKATARLEVLHEYDERIKQLQQDYENAKAKEQSLANRTLTAATMAATGIGGMELAQGLAEQNADKQAEADMTAYISTFNCKVGDKRYKGGETGVELPGANQLTQLYQEYTALAADLKVRKEALGKAPGIEAQVILDKANMGLYNDVGRGIENGAYASLYRASKGNENDIQKLQDQQDASKKRVTAGAVVGGVGAAGGMVGNMIINGDDGESDNSGINQIQQYLQ